MASNEITMEGKVCLVTGATGGIGKVTARELARRGARVVIAGRSPARCQAACQEIIQATGNREVDYLVADLALQRQVRGLAAAFLEKYARLDVLVNNAGAYLAQRQVTDEGVEMTWALNHLGYFLLTQLLRERLEQTGRPGAAARIVNVASDAHQWAKLDFDDLQNRRSYHGFQAYSQSKLANVMFTYAQARRLEGCPVTCNVLHPGFVRTGFGVNNTGLVGLGMRLVARLFAMDVEKGARTSIYLAADPAVEGVSGKYFIKQRAAQSSPASRVVADQERLWAVSLEMVGERRAGDYAKPGSEIPDS